MENMTAAQIEQALHGASAHMCRIVSICGQGSYEAREAKARIVELSNAYLKYSN